MNEKTIQCVPNPSKHVPVCLEQFRMQLFEPQVQKIAVLRTAAHIFVSPGDAPAIITQYVQSINQSIGLLEMVAKWLNS